MSQATYATISTIAQSLGISHVKESIASKLSHECKRNILKILCDAVQIRNTSKSTRLKSTHINAALESNYLEPLFGYNDSTDKYQLIQAGCVDAMDLLTYQDQQIPIEFLQRYENKPYPIDTTIDFSWVAVQGQNVRSEEEQDLDNYEPGYAEKSDAKPYLQQMMIQRQNNEHDYTMSSKHFISYELKLYNQTSRQLLLSSDISEREKMLFNLRKEKCLETLVPYYIRFSQKKMIETPKKYNNLYISVSVVRAIVQNEDISSDIYIQQLISIALTLLVSVCPIPEQFIIRDYAADLLKLIVDKSVANYPTVQPNLTAQLISILMNPKPTVSQKYGALAALQKFGLETTSEYLSPILPKLLRDSNMLKVVHSKNSENLTKFYDSAVQTAGLCLHSDSYKTTSTGLYPMNPKTMSNYREIMDTFGADLLPYYIDDAALLAL
ncbi:putative TBP-associated protein [Tritrichomonas foetus]|uniref:TBP-associated protein n=1 Tax=Tritrichomonas foetus TaxID=1144522 RepID=A0A1J4JTH6_9EUKA|nr:putative TBP-associated protein [Tritrichomonas foetus]|eukprot:OHT02425.1 putative TBP-associated protein [Tritrichomonas foetus]